ncbi:HAMP domain-containing histidine kinase [Iodobacter sp. HSC-16F04]|uniref:histidine kinase n=1 Tax=Iodobacter violaceini TaxID=3044271 RepID=A0ABX0KWW4_9NEIS|nr:HAMP domain-containing sensor histidine kinase [Iodobacter violacea]NHQ86599.1 HAMP domain-containing histidine kinase [Iodobacter violacea]
MPNPKMAIDPRELESAFSLFTEASNQLSLAYADLQQQVVSLTGQLEIANGNLRRELDEKAALSRRLSVLLERLPGGVVELNEQGVVVELNPAARSMMQNLSLGCVWQEYIGGFLQPTNVPDLWLSQSSKGERRLSIVVNNMPGEFGKIMLVHDISDTWELQRALTQHKRLAAMGEMAAGLAHQLRTPLATALLYSTHLAKPALSDSDRHKFGQKNLARLRHLEVLIQNMLSFVRGHEVPAEPVILSGLLREAQQLMLPQLQAQDMNCVLDLPLEYEHLVVNANHKELLGCVTNLIDNARLASKPGDVIELFLSARENMAELRVEDHGCGMSSEVQERLFEPFFTTRKEGTGLGLAIVSNLLARLGGEIGVNSNLGTGSSFTIRLPVLYCPTKV